MEGGEVPRGVGFAVTSALGAVVGSLVPAAGMCVGSRDGPGEGLAVGDGDGKSEEGSDVGATDGSFVGA